MLTPVAPTHCPICDSALHQQDLSAHLRTLHQVALGETTIVDVPVGRWTHGGHDASFATIEEFEEDLMAAGIA